MRQLLIVVTTTISLTTPTAIAADGRTVPEPTVRIHDYANIALPTIQYAQRLVTKLYAAAGIALRWAPAVRYSHDPHVDIGPAGTEDLSVLVLNRRMADHYTSSRDIAGFAAVGNDESQGRIAYVLYDRVEAAARSCRCPVADVMSLVIAHEIGHLLLPRGSHSTVGIMRKRWHHAELRSMHRRAVQFTSGQAEQIRHRLRFTLGGAH
jgi:hypothetical protein